MPKLSQDDEAKLSVVLTAILHATKAKNNLAKVMIAFATQSQGGAPLDVATAIEQIDAAMQDLKEAHDEIRVFRNFVRDDRSANVKLRAGAHERNPWRHRDIYGAEFPRHQRDPQALINHMLGRNRD